jgi:hypothetical protein
MAQDLAPDPSLKPLAAQTGAEVLDGGAPGLDQEPQRETPMSDSDTPHRIPRIPTGAGEPAECPLPLCVLNRVRASRAHAELQWAYEAAVRGYLQPGTCDRFESAKKAANDALWPAEQRCPDITALEVVAFYALFPDGNISDPQQVRDHDQAARLAVWLAVRPGR